MEENHYTLTVKCYDELGLVYRITKILFEHHLNVLTNSEYVDRESNMFFMRSEFFSNIDPKQLETLLLSVLPTGAVVNMFPKKKKPIVILATKEYHCLGDLLIRYEGKDIQAEILAVISNHPTLEEMVTRFKIPFHYISHENKERNLQEREILECIQMYKPEYIILAKYMRILSSQFVESYKHKIINIHHSFLPAFIGASPYKQAYTRGVKIIGATAHFVTESLDDGPIIYQSTIPVNHTHSAEDMAKLGRDIEKLVLAKSLELVLDNQVMINGNKTVIL
jgi:formyltetrahydrofolate deformylase